MDARCSPVDIQVCAQTTDARTREEIFLKCFECGDPGHVATSCPNIEQLGDGRPMWCGTCDQRSRHYYDARGRAIRCQCHPLSHQLLKQHSRCPACKQVIYQWDPSECGHHQETGKQWEHVETGARPVVRDEDALRAKALAQVAESRAARAIV